MLHLNLPGWAMATFLIIWSLACSILITSGIILFSARYETELVRAFGGGLLMLGVLSAGGFLLFITDHYL